MDIENLPDWASYNKAEDIVEVDPDVAYPLYLKKLGWDKGTLTQNRLECARRCFTEDLLKITGKGLHLRIIKKFLELDPEERSISIDHISGDETDQGPAKKQDTTWRLSNYPEGEPINWQTEYKRIAS